MEIWTIVISAGIITILLTFGALIWYQGVFIWYQVLGNTKRTRAIGKQKQDFIEAAEKFANELAAKYASIESGVQELQKKYQIDFAKFKTWLDTLSSEEQEQFARIGLKLARLLGYQTTVIETVEEKSIEAEKQVTALSAQLAQATAEKERWLQMYRTLMR